MIPIATRNQCCQNEFSPRRAANRYRLRLRCLRYAKRTTLYKGTRDDLGHEHLRGQPSHGVLHLEWLRRATRLRPDDPAVLLQLADAEWAAGLHGEAANHYQYLLERAPGHAERHRILERLAEGGDPAVR